MDLSRFSLDSLLGNGNGHAEGLRVAAPEKAAGEADGTKKPRGAVSPRRLEDSPAGLGGAQEEGLGGAGEKKSEREGDGKFARGCKGGPGNPYNRQVARLKRLLLEAVTEEDIVAIGKKLVQLTLEGNVAAARVLFTYVLPKGVEPDRVDMDEWKGYREEVGMTQQLMPILREMEPDLPLSLVRGLRPEISLAKSWVMKEVVLTGSMDFLASPEQLRVVASGGGSSSGSGGGQGKKKARGKRSKRRRGG